MTRRQFLLAAALAVICLPCSAGGPPRIAIIIDDVGYQASASRRAIDLPGPVACAILPDAPRARQLAQAATDGGKEVLLHLPMDAVGGNQLAEPSQVTLDMSRASFKSVVSAAFDAVPTAVGVSNHRGSLLTRHPGHMRWLMEEMRLRDGLFFVDSYTTHESVALQIAAEAGVSAVKRDVFLDNDRSATAIAKEFERLKSLATKHGVAVAIGHPYDATLAFLEQQIPLLAEQGFELVPVSELVSGDEL